MNAKKMRIENMYYSLLAWLSRNIGNEQVSDNLYEIVKSITADVKDDLDEIEIIGGVA